MLDRRGWRISRGIVTEYETVNDDLPLNLHRLDQVVLHPNRQGQIDHDRIYTSYLYDPSLNGSDTSSMVNDNKVRSDTT